jgi:hypothetical protein
MVSLRFHRFRVVVYPNDHGPPHVHVVGPGWELRVALNAELVVISMAGDVRSRDVVQALAVVERERHRLLIIWRELHGE